MGESPMKRPRICANCLLSILLIGILGCGGSVSYLKKGPEVITNTITINNCLATPDTAQVPDNTIVTWIVDTSDSHTYSINFPKSKPFPTSTISPGKGQTAQRDSACKYFSWLNANYCVYAYNLIQVGVQTCKDPGLHVTPQ